jgi:hypothetical protein
MPVAIVHRCSLLFFGAIVALAGAHCAGDAADTSGSPGPSAGADAGRDAGASVGSDGSGGNDGSSRGDGPESGAPAEGGAAGSDAAAGADADASQCSPPCSAAAPVCDRGVCKKVEVVAFYTPDPQMYDRAHAAYARHANAWFPQAAADQQFFTYESTTDWDRLKTIAPAAGRVILFLDNYPGDPAQQAGFQSYVDSGGAWMGCHVSAYNDDSSHWDWYFNQFLGCGHFNNNTWAPTSAKLDVEDPAHPLSAGLGAMFDSAPSEFYSWVVDLRTKSNIKILLSVDPASFPLGTDPNQSWYSGYYPIAWTNTNYKMLYVNMGHEQMDYSTDTPLSSTFDSPTQNQMYMNAFKWLGRATQ